MTFSVPPADPDLSSENSSTDLVEEEDTLGESETTNVQPWNPAKIRIVTKNFSLREIVEQIDTNDVDLAPDFQRDFVWKRRQRTRLIESILLGIPLPAFYFNQEDDGSYQVVDGVQRLSTIHLFMTNNHVLDANDLEYLHDLHGLRYSDLEQSVLRRFRSSQIVVHVIEPQTPDEVKYDIFGRVNTLGSPLSAQEIRHAMSKARSREFLHNLSEMKSFDIATNFNFWRVDSTDSEQKIRNTGRMMNRELALRFCAFKKFSLDEYRSFTSLDSYLVNYTRRLDEREEVARNISDQELKLLTMAFQRAMVNADVVLGPLAFRRAGRDMRRLGPINRAVFEAQAIALADCDPTLVLTNKEKIKANLLELFNDNNYVKAVTVGTGAYFRVEERLEKTRLAVEDALR